MLLGVLQSGEEDLNPCTQVANSDLLEEEWALYGLLITFDLKRPL